MAIKTKTQLGVDIAASTFTAPQQVILEDMVDSYEDIFSQLTTAQRDLLTPTSGLIIYNTDVDSYQYWNGSVWVGLAGLNSPMTVKVDFNNAAMMTLGGARLDVVTAAGTGYAIDVQNVSYRMTYATAAFDFAQDLALNFISSSGYHFTIDKDAINAGATRSGYATKDTTVTNDIIVEDEDFELWTNVAATVGGGSLTLWVTYSIVNY